MAARRPAKIASSKKGSGFTRLCPETGKPMSPVRVFRQDGPSGMYWVVIEDFDGSDRAINRMVAAR